MEKMRTREDVLKELEEVKKEAAGAAQFGSPQALVLQAGANAPLMATALGSLLEVALDIRDMVRGCHGALDFIGSEVASIEAMVERHITGQASVTSAPSLEEVPVIHISNEERIKELLDAGKLPGFEEVCENCGTRMEVSKQDEKAVEWTCPKCKRLVQSVIKQPE